MQALSDIKHTPPQSIELAEETEFISMQSKKVKRWIIGWKIRH